MRHVYKSRGGTWTNTGRILRTQKTQFATHFHFHTIRANMKQTLGLNKQTDEQRNRNSLQFGAERSVSSHTHDGDWKNDRKSRIAFMTFWVPLRIMGKTSSSLSVLSVRLWPTAPPPTTESTTHNNTAVRKPISATPDKTVLTTTLKRLNVNLSRYLVKVWRHFLMMFTLFHRYIPAQVLLILQVPECRAAILANFSLSTFFCYSNGVEWLHWRIVFSLHRLIIVIVILNVLSKLRAHV